MEHKFTGKQVDQIINHIASVLPEDTNLDFNEVVEREIQKVIDSVTAKTLTELNSKFSKELERCLKNMDKIRAEYNKYFKTDRYSVAEKKRQEDLMEAELNTEITSLSWNLNYEVEQFIKNFDINKKAISSIEYQIRLSNTLKLLEIDPSLTAEYFDFIVEAKDFGLLNILKDKYKSQTLITLSESLDKNKIEKMARQKVQTLVSYVKQGENFIPKSALFDLVK